jgi:hypothetical protein
VNYIQSKFLAWPPVVFNTAKCPTQGFAFRLTAEFWKADGYG